MSAPQASGITMFILDPATGRITQHPPARRYAVQTRFFGDHWANCWTDENGNPVTFATRREAQAEIDGIIEDTSVADSEGDLLSAYFPDDFRIVEVQP